MRPNVLSILPQVETSNHQRTDLRRGLLEVHVRCGVRVPGALVDGHPPFLPGLVDADEDALEVPVDLGSSNPLDDGRPVKKKQKCLTPSPAHTYNEYNNMFCTALFLNSLRVNF